MACDGNCGEELLAPKKSHTLVGSAGIRIAGKPIADIFMMDPDDLVREIYVDQSIAEKIIGMELSEQQVDIQIRNRVATARVGLAAARFI